MPAWLRGILPVVIAIAVLLVLQILLGDLPFFVYLASIVGVNVILAVSLNIVNGMTGQFSIGHAGFMAVGAYTAGKLSLLIKDVAISGLPGVVSDQVQFVGTLLAGGLAAAVCGFIVGLPSLRLRGDYLAIVTLGFGEIIRVVVQNLDTFGRALGLSGIPQTSSLFAVWFCVFLVVLVARRIVGSTHGRSLWAIREDEVAAEAMGVDTTSYKVRAFVISSFFAGVAGGLILFLGVVSRPAGGRLIDRPRLVRASFVAAAAGTVALTVATPFALAVAGAAVVGLAAGPGFAVGSGTSRSISAIGRSAGLA